jgi:hypothetical protein
MEKVLSNELTKLVMILGAVTIGLSVLMVRAVGKVKASFTPYKRQTIVYGIVAVLLFALVALLAYPSLINSPMTSFIVFQACFLALGIAHILFTRINLAWVTENKALPLNIIFTLLVGILGTIVFLMVHQWINKDGMPLTMAASIIFFLVPFLFFQTYRKAAAIPPKIVKEWYYPVGQEIDEPEDNKLKDPLVISFEFQKQISDKSSTNFRAKAPVNMEFGELFYYFINDYNERHPNSKVQVTDVKGKAYGWVFYKKSDWKTFFTKYIDSEKTVRANHIRENEIIICARSGD